MISSISAGIPSIFIFLLVGVLISVWIAAGTIPTLMVYGFQLVSPKIFVPTVFVVCAIVGTRSAFTTAATVGLALWEWVLPLIRSSSYCWCNYWCILRR